MGGGGGGEGGVELGGGKGAVIKDRAWRLRTDLGKQLYLRV